MNLHSSTNSMIRGTESVVDNIIGSNSNNSKDGGYTNACFQPDNSVVAIVDFEESRQQKLTQNSVSQENNATPNISERSNTDSGSSLFCLTKKHIFCKKFKNMCQSKIPLTPKVKVMITICLWQFFMGVERSIIMPTLWLFLLKQFSQHDAEIYYGGTLAAFNVTVFICSPIFGFLSGYMKIPVKALLVLSNLFEIIGNVLYFVAGKPWIILIGRLVAGIGGGSEVPLYADIVRCTNNSERTGIIIILLATRHLGLIVGPAFTLMVSHVTFSISGLNFNVYNLPGLLMSSLWVLHTIFSFFFYPKVDHLSISPSDNSETNRLLNSTTSLPDVTNEPFMEQSTPSDKKISHRTALSITVSSEQDDKSFTSVSENHQVPPDDEEDKKSSKSNVCCCTSSFCCIRLQSNISIFLRENCNFSKYFNIEISTMLVSVFSLYICVMGLEAVLPPVAQRYFNWNETQISCVYFGCGAFIVIGYLFLRCLSKHLTDRVLLGMGVFVLVIAYSALTVVLIYVNKEHVPLYASLIVTLVVIHVVGVQFCIASTESLFSKISPVEDAERAQSIFRTIINISFLVGPYVGGQLQGTAHVVMLIMCILMSISGILYVFAYPKLSPPVHHILENTS